MAEKLTGHEQMVGQEGGLEQETKFVLESVFEAGKEAVVSIEEMYRCIKEPTDLDRLNFVGALASIEKAKAISSLLVEGHPELVQQKGALVDRRFKRLVIGRGAIYVAKALNEAVSYVEQLRGEGARSVKNYRLTLKALERAQAMANGGGIKKYPSLDDATYNAVTEFRKKVGLE